MVQFLQPGQALIIQVPHPQHLLSILLAAVMPEITHVWCRIHAVQAPVLLYHLQ